MRRRSYTIAVLALSASAAAALAATYTWSGLGADDNWSTCANWTGSGCYPDSTADSAIIPDANNTWDIDLMADEHIDALTVERSTDIGVGTNGEVTLEVETLTIDAGGDEVVLTIASDATIEINE